MDGARRRIRSASIRCALVGSVALAASCDSGGDPRPAPGVTVERRDSAGVPVLILSRTPNEIARGGGASIVAPGLELGTGDVWFGMAIDVASLGGGRFAVLDWMERSVRVFDSLGHEVARHGREGGGPGEYRMPWVLEAVGRRLVVWQNRGEAAFTVLEPGGGVRATANAVIAGDWTRPRFRRPLVDLYGFQLGVEDVTRRLAPLGDSGFIHLLQPDELRAPERRSRPEPPAWLVRYGLDARPRDTLATLAGTPVLYSEEPVLLPGTGERRTIPMWRQPLFSAGPVWTTGDGWIALGHGDSTRIVVRRFAGDTVAVVHWPQRRDPVTERDRIDAAIWGIRARIFGQLADRREEIVRMPPDEYRKWIEYDIEHAYSFAEVAPTVTAAYGVGACLLLAGHAPADWGDGTALTWVALNVETGELEHVLRLRPPDAKPLGIEAFERRGAAVRGFDRRFAYAIFRDGDGVSHVARYRLPAMDCAGAHRTGAPR